MHFCLVGAGAPQLQPLVTVGLWHGLGQVATVLSLGAGAVSFTHIVKALEPFFSAMVSAVVSHEVLKPQVYATLLPVVGGVALAVAAELSFSWWAFSTALGSNLAFALRAVLSKKAMVQLQAGASKTGASAKDKGGSSSVGTRTLSAPSVFGVVTWAAFGLMLPLALLVEGKGAAAAWSKATASMDSVLLARQLALSGLFHYLNNEVMYLVLSEVHPITLAVGNTLKRVVIIGVSLLVFRNPISLTAAVGSAIGVGGVLLYSLTKQYYDKLESLEAKNK
jgi:solute carrier family 35 protein E1